MWLWMPKEVDRDLNHGPPVDLLLNLTARLLAREAVRPVVARRRGPSAAHHDRGPSAAHHDRSPPRAPSLEMAHSRVYDDATNASPQ